MFPRHRQAVLTFWHVPLKTCGVSGGFSFCLKLLEIQTRCCMLSAFPRRGDEIVCRARGRIRPCRIVALVLLAEREAVAGMQGCQSLNFLERRLLSISLNPLPGAALFCSTRQSGPSIAATATVI